MGWITYNYILTCLILASACTYMRGKKQKNYPVQTFNRCDRLNSPANRDQLQWKSSPETCRSEQLRCILAKLARLRTDRQVAEWLASNSGYQSNITNDEIGL